MVASVPTHAPAAAVTSLGRHVPGLAWTLEGGDPGEKVGAMGVGSGEVPPLIRGRAGTPGRPFPAAAAAAAAAAVAAPPLPLSHPPAGRS
eukprot:scaffold119160_cov14-Tisochrysis_lutea.AAC.1